MGGPDPGRGVGRVAAEQCAEQRPEPQERRRDRRRRTQQQPGPCRHPRVRRVEVGGQQAERGPAVPPGAAGHVLVAGGERDRLGDPVLHRAFFAADDVRGGLEDQRHRQRGQVKAAGRVRRPPGRRQGFVRAELLVQPGGDLQVERRGQGQCSLGDGQFARLLEPVHALGPELVDGAQLVQGPQPPQPQPVRVGQVRRPGERPLGRLQVALPGDPADHLEGLARHLGLDRLLPFALGRPERGPGQAVGLLQAAPARGDLRRAGVDLGGVGARRLAGDLDARGGLGPPGPAIAARAISRCRRAARGDGGPSRARSIRPVWMARSTCPDMAKTSVSASSTLVCSAGPTRSRARISVCSALASAPAAKSRRPAWSSSAPAGRVAGPAGQAGG